MSDPHQLLQEFIAADEASGGDADPMDFLDRAPAGDRTELEALIDAYLAQAPRRPFDAKAFAASPARDTASALWQSMAGESGRWPTVLPSLRHRAQITRAQLVARLATALGFAGRESKVAAYYHAMERGDLPASGVHDRVLDALGEIVGESGRKLRDLGRTLAGPASPGTTASPVFARIAEPDEEYLGHGGSASSTDEVPPGERDEIDELFTGASEG